MQPRQSCVYSGVDEFRVVPPPDMEEEVGGKPTHARISSPPTGGVCVNHCQPGRSSDYDGEIHCAKKTRQARWRCRGEEVVVGCIEREDNGVPKFRISRSSAFPRSLLQWEICNDGGFVYKRRRRRSEEEDQDRPAAAGPEADLRRHARARRRRSASTTSEIGTGGSRRSGSASRPTCSTPSPPPLRRPSLRRRGRMSSRQSSTTSSLSQVQDRRGKKPGIGRALTKPGFYVLQVEAQEAVIGKLAEARAYVESLCREKEGSYRSGQALRLLRLRYQTD
ncbi:hypothetical protein B296_00005397 [Ensete ventricosum]|uniref:Uncharacterized protein n=1 Tax=Ensete ventricosum TaxID=4639 RepID=A0A427B7X4_ENSVE|nr:hypothetical protein B296_00005397 [Ensete ventricosum]